MSTTTNQMAALTALGIKKRQGIFPKCEKTGWTGIGLVNPQTTEATITLTAYNDYGGMAARKQITLPPYAKHVSLAEDLFDQDISHATYLTYSANKEVIGFQCNGSSDNSMLDALPAL